MRKVNFIAIVVGFLAVFTISFSSHASEAVKGAKEDLKTFKKEVNAKLEDIDKQIAELKAKAKSTSSKAEKETQATIDDLNASRKKLAKQLDELTDDGKEGWKKFKTDLADSVDKLSGKIQKALRD